MKLIEYSVRKNLFKNHAENETWRLVPDPFLFSEKVLYQVKANGLHLGLNIFGQPTAWAYNKNKLYETSDT